MYRRPAEPSELLGVSTIASHTIIDITTRIVLSHGRHFQSIGFARVVSYHSMTTNGTIEPRNLTGRNPTYSARSADRRESLFQCEHTPIGAFAPGLLQRTFLCNWRILLLTCSIANGQGYLLVLLVVWAHQAND